MSGFLVQAAVFLGAAAVTVPIFNRLKLGSILGYLAAGVLVGPFGLNLIHLEEGVFHVAELGVVLFLFVIGLELSFSRLWSMRTNIFGLGAAQMALTGAAIAGVFVASGVMPAASAIIAGLALAFSSTAFAMQLMKDRGEINSGYGARAFPVLLFQDLAVIPVLAAIPFLSGAAGEAVHTAGWANALRALAVIGALVVIGRFGLNPLLRIVARSGSREAFAATALFIVAAVSLAMAWAGLSMALGAFLAGALLAESAFRHQVETDIEPFRGLLLGLFFIFIGMRLDFNVIAANLPAVFGGAAGLIALKTALLYASARAFGASHADALQTGAVLSQGGEFGFVVFSLGAAQGLFNGQQASLLSAIVTISMAATPPLTALARRLSRTPTREDGMEQASGGRGHVLIVGFGRMGQIISQVLMNSGFEVVAIDRNPEHITNAERFGFKVYFGDGGRLDTLVTAGALDARAVILCMDDPEAVNRAVEGLRERSEGLPIFAVAHDRMHEIELRKLRPTEIVRETLESSLLLARKALSHLGHDERTVEDFLEQFRASDRERLLAQMDYGLSARVDLIHRRYQRPRED